jgi:transcriptional regulator
MRENPAYTVTEEGVVRELIEANPWATIVSAAQDGPIASHYPLLLDRTSEQLAVLTHVGRPDEQLHELGSREILLIVAGAHGYISPSWYSELATPAPTWNFSVAHCYGTPEILDAEENLQVLSSLVEHFERHVAEPVALEPGFGARLARGTVGIRVPISRFVCKVKMSQDKDAQSQQQVLAELRGSGPYATPRRCSERCNRREHLGSRDGLFEGAGRAGALDHRRARGRHRAQDVRQHRLDAQRPHGLRCAQR